MTAERSRSSTSGLADRIGRAILDEGQVDPRQAEDHLEIVRRAAEADRVARDLLHQSVAAARAHGHSWSALGDVLGMSRQAAQQRFGARTDDETTKGAGTRVLGPITAFDELSELELAGRQGWHTVGAGMFTHTMTRTDTQWEHKRVVWSRPTSRYLTDGWQVGARAFPWLYLVRDLGIPAEPDPG